MTTRAVEQLDEWESSPFRDGYRGLHDLADSGFSGIVEAGRAKLCLLNGTAVGILDGDIDDFEGASGTAYEAPSPALPLLALMQERNEEVRGKYYSEDTPLSEVDDTLSDGGFTGFIELSENVLSGDYYVVYHRGRSMAVAWVGNSGQLLTDDEAFERADDEVGIFAVHPAELDPVEIPEVDDGPDAAGVGPDGDDAAAAAGAGAAGAASAADEDETDEPEPAAADDPASEESEPAADVDDGTAASSQSGRADAAGTDDDAAEADDDSEPADAPADPGRPTDQGDRNGAVASDTAEEPPEAEGATGSDAVASEPTTEPTDAATDRRGTTDRRDRTERAGDDPDPEVTGSDRVRESDRSAADADRTYPASERPTESDESADASAGRTDDGRTDDDRHDDGRRDDERDRSGRSQRRRERADRTPDRGDTDEGREPGRRSADARTGRESEPPTDREPAEDRGREGSSDRREARSSEPRSTEARSGGSADTGARDRSGATNESPGRSSDSTAREVEREERSADAGDASGAVSAPDQLETHSVPSLDPDRTTSRESDDGAAAAAAPESPEPADPSAGEASDRAASTGRETRERQDSRSPAASGQAAAERSESQSAEPRATDARQAEPRATEPDPGRADERVADLEEELADRESEIERLEADLAAAESERDDLRSELESVRAERDDLQSRIERVESERDKLERERDDLESEVADLESELERMEGQLAEIEEEFGAAVDAEQRLSPGEALDGTNLFVRYESKGKATLETAHAGEASRQEVGENLGLEYHTQFDSETASVGGRPFDEFLRETMQFRFVTWVINDLLYEIRDTGKNAALQDLYDAIPQIDRAELNGTVSTEYTEDGQERRSQESFDVVMRDRMGNALLTANMNDSRQAASESMMSALVTATSHVGESTESLGASFLVTSSFFEPEALETAADATSGGLLSRDKRESFVKLTRKQGYHLCLVEAREEKFHLAVPEL